MNKADEIAKRDCPESGNAVHPEREHGQVCQPNAMSLFEKASLSDASLFTLASPWGPFIVLVPVTGAFGVTLLVTKFAPETRGHGVPEVMDAIYYRGGIIPIVAVVKSLASALATGSGAAVGREGGQHVAIASLACVE